jgi:hypothetical protein
MERTVMRGAGGKQIADHGLGPILDKPEWHYAGRPLVGLAMRDAMQRLLVASLRPGTLALVRFPGLLQRRRHDCQGRARADQAEDVEAQRQRTRRREEREGAQFDFDNIQTQ